MKEIAIPSVLAAEKKLVPSDAILMGNQWNERRERGSQPLELHTKSVRGTISNRLKLKGGDDPAKLDAAIEKPNLQTVDYCDLPTDCDTLKLRFTLKVLSGVENLSACNGADFSESYRSAVRSYIDQYGFRELAQRYAVNLANGRFLWRNRVGAEQIEVVVRHLNGDDQGQVQWIFDAKAIGLQGFDSLAVAELAAIIAESLSGQREFALFAVTAYARLGAGQEVYPSQELILDKETKSKVLYQTGGVAALHSQKVGNAIRTIDTWYPNAERPIAVESYGSVTSEGKAYRKPVDKTDFYTLFDSFGRGGNLTAEQSHYVMAMMVRGGVFGQSSK